MGLILDTSFVVCAEREARRRRPGACDAFLAEHPGETFHLTFTVVGELACGRSVAAREEWRKLCRPYRILPWSVEIAWQYGEIYRQLSGQGRLIGTNDLWIAATAIAHGMPLVSNNLAEFARVDGLQVLGF